MIYGNPIIFKKSVTRINSSTETIIKNIVFHKKSCFFATLYGKYALSAPKNARER